MLSKLEDSDWGFVVYAPKTFKKGGDSQRESPLFKGLIRTPYLPLSDSSQLASRKSIPVSARRWKFFSRASAPAVPTS